MRKSGRLWPILFAVLITVGCRKPETSKPVTLPKQPVLSNLPPPARLEKQAETSPAQVHQESSAHKDQPVAPANSVLPSVRIGYVPSQLPEVLASYQSNSGNNDARADLAEHVVEMVNNGLPKPQAVEGLGKMFAMESSVEVKSRLLEQLGDLEDPVAFDQIIKAFDPQQPQEVWVAAIEALETLGDQRAIPILRQQLTDPDEEIRDAANYALKTLTDK